MLDLIVDNHNVWPKLSPFMCVYCREKKRVFHILIYNMCANAKEKTHAFTGWWLISL